MPDPETHSTLTAHAERLCAVEHDTARQGEDLDDLDGRLQNVTTDVSDLQRETGRCGRESRELRERLDDVKDLVESLRRSYNDHVAELHAGVEPHDRKDP